MHLETGLRFFIAIAAAYTAIPIPAPQGDTDLRLRDSLDTASRR